MKLLSLHLLRNTMMIASAVLMPVACSSIDYKPGERPRMVVTEEHTPVYFHGPAQGNGPDVSLSKGDEVNVIRKEFGYSIVQLAGGQTGYVSNEAIAPAPPQASLPTSGGETPPDSNVTGSNSTVTNADFRY